MTSKHSIHKYLLEHKDEIIEQYKNRVRVMDIAQRHNVSSTTITQIMRKWGIPRRGSKDKSVIVKKYNISPKLLAQRAVNNVINHQFVRRVSAGDSPEDQRLISAMLQMVIRG